MINSKKLIVIIDGPSGVGKDTVINELIARYPNNFDRPINATTREMRPNESQNNPYYFISEEEFFKLRKSGDIFEHTIRHGTYRGMRKSSFDAILDRGKIALRDCDKYGLLALKEAYGNIVLSIFLTISKDEIKNRLKSRNEPNDSMERRLNDYDTYIEDAKHYDYVVENYNINTTIDSVIKIINDNTLYKI